MAEQTTSSITIDATPAEVMAGFLRRGIGIEAMTNGSAARTYSLLAGEGRKVVAAFILP